MQSYKPPEPSKEDTLIFNNRLKAIQEWQEELLTNKSLTYKEFVTKVNELNFMRKACRAYCSKFRLKIEIP